MLLGDCHMSTFIWASLPHPSIFLFFLEGICFFGLSKQLFGKGSSNTEKILIFLLFFQYMLIPPGGICFKSGIGAGQSWT